ncbi:hypothetical protein JB92DRAFT_602234 [Gautieria morchelliformis]|nr:hypothetical protein JB92DRAFT_602234 [Gautieria morchelliformis]
MPTCDYRFQTSIYALYFYDHLLTFSDEVDKIWLQPFTFASLLFYINRYFTHGQFIILNNFMKQRGPMQCNGIMKFPGAGTLCLVAIAELIMILRVYAIYLANKYVLVFLLSILSGQIITEAWGVQFSIRIPQPSTFPGCVPTGSNNWFAALWVAPLVTDACIFVLTIWRTVRYKRKHGRMTTMDIILRDGIMYFFVIFSANLMNSLIYFLAPEDLKAVGASFSQLLTATMISRLQLNLRQARRSGTIHADTPRRLKVNSPRKPSESSRNGDFLDSNDATATVTFFTLGNLGEEIQGSFFEASDTKGIPHEEIEMGPSGHVGYLRPGRV